MCPFSASVHNSAESYFYLPLGGGHQTDGNGPDFAYVPIGWEQKYSLVKYFVCVCVCVCVSLTGIICAREESTFYYLGT